jgi:hypothetical protein
MAIAISSGFCAESTREIEEKTSQQNNTDYATAEHSSANEKSPGNEQNSQTQKKNQYFHGLTYLCVLPLRQHFDFVRVIGLAMMKWRH